MTTETPPDDDASRSGEDIEERSKTGAAGAEGEHPRPAKMRKGRRRRAVGVGTLILTVALLAIGAWIASQALTARDSLESARAGIAKLRDEAVADPAGAVATIDTIRADTERARIASDGVVWRAAERVPFLGRNLTVVRELSSAVDGVAEDALGPLASVASTLDPASLRPVDGAIDLAPIAAAADAVTAAANALETAQARVDGIDAEGVVDQVSNARDELAGLLDEAVTLSGGLRTLTDLAPPMLGADGPRNYLLILQNNAEARSLGGNPAALVLVEVDGGRITLARQASSLDFPRDGEPPVPIDPALLEVYYPSFPRYVMDITTRPDFPTAAILAKGYWERYIGGSVDGVISFDPVALGYLLRATGPVTLVTGDRLTSDNAVPLLLSEVYARYSEARDQDLFFAAAAASVFDAVTAGDLDASRLFSALQQAGEERRLLLWSDRPEEQTIIQTTPISGVLPMSNEDETSVGVFFMDQSSSKMDYYLDTSVVVSSDRCTADRPTFRTAVTLTSDLTVDQARALPGYVASYFFGSERFKTDVYVLGPVGSTYAGVDSPDALLSAGEDLGRPVVRLSTFLTPGESRTLTVDFTGAAGPYGPLGVIATPMVRPTVVEVDAPSC